VSAGEDVPATAASPRPAEAVLPTWSSDARAVAESWRPRLSAALGGTAILLLVGFSLGLCLWELLNAADLQQFVSSNVAVRERGTPPVVFGAGGAALVAAAVFALLGKRGLAGDGWAIWHAAARVSPGVLAGLVPLLFHWRFWQGSREVVFLLLGLVLVFGGHRLLQLAFQSPPLFGRPAFLRRRRADRQALWQATARFLPLVIVLLVAIGYSVFFSYFTVVHHRNILSSSLDLGLEENVIWNALHKGALFRTTPYGGPTGNLIGEHAAYLSFLLAPIYAIHQSAETILVIQATLIGCAAVPLYLVARQYLSPWLACLVAVWYVFYPPVHGSNLYDFHYPPLAPFFLWFTLYFVLVRRNVLAGIFAVVTLSVREDVSLGLVICGLFLVVTNRRARAGVVLVAVGVLYFVGMKLWIMPMQRGGQEAFIHQYAGLVPNGSHGFSGVMKSVLGNPAFTLRTVLEPDKLVYLLEIFLPLAFFPLRRPIGLLCCIPGFLFTLLSTGYRPLYQISFQYTAHWTSYLFIALVANLAWLDREARRRGPAGAAWRRAWIVAISLGMLVTSYQLGAILQRNATRGGFGTYHFGTTAEDRERRRTLYELIAMVPKNAKIVSSENIVPQVSNRAYAYTLRMGIADADYLLFSIPPGGDERQKVLDVLPDGTFGVVAERGQYVLAKRGHRTDLNAGVLSRVR
jgi:uncharacterized membrane protein